MRRCMENPAVQGGVRCASDWRHNPNISIFDDNIKHRLRLSHLRRWHGLTGSRAALIAGLVFGEGVRAVGADSFPPNVLGVVVRW